MRIRLARIGIPGGLLLLLTIIPFHTAAKMNPDNDATRSLVRLQQEWITEFVRHGPAVMERLIADDFIYTSETSTIGKQEFILLAKKLDLSELRIELTDVRVRVFGIAAVSTGSVVLRRQGGDPIKGQSKTASDAAVVNLGELSRQEKQTSSKGKAKGVPAPMPIPHDHPVPVAEARYRYMAMYAKFRGRWQIVALHLSQTAPE
jgi:Domain of unknown function (DUF4440)